MSDTAILTLLFTTIYLIPLSLTAVNIVILVSRKYVIAHIVYPITVLAGSILYYIFILVYSSNCYWDVPLMSNELHEPISSQYLPGFLIPAAAGYLGLAILIYLKDTKRPPLLSAFAIASIVVGDIIQLAMCIQLAANLTPFSTSGALDKTVILLPYIYHINIFIISAYALRKQITGQLKIFDAMKEENGEATGGRKVDRLYEIIHNMSQYSFLVFICLFIFIAILEFVFILMGQSYDAGVKAFTDTADWTFSQQIPPPPTYYSGHYLCTVAAGGHKKVVKPLRLGLRRGAIIVVNRQLCIANAFEDYIKEKTPRFHRFIRNCYDKYGYPISQYINTPLKADIVYFFMKPLEWIFLIFLYMFDTRPEKRIKNQYVLKN